MKKILLALLSLQLSVIALGQQDAQFSQNRFINNALNPGAVGIKGADCFGLMARQQWIGYEGRPNTGFLSYEKALTGLNAGIGGVLVYDAIGFERNLFFKVNGAYHFTLSNGAKIGVGLDLGLISKSISGTFVVGNTADPLLANLSGQSALNLDVGVGAFYFTDKLYFGISGQKLVPQRIKWGDAEPQIRPHSYFMGGYNYALNDEFDLKPSFLVKTDFTSTQVDVNLILEWQKQVWLGASYRVQDAIVAMAGMNIGGVLPNPIKVGLAYDFTTQSLRDPADTEIPDGSIKENNKSWGAAELFIGYCFIPPVKPPFDIYVDPLFLNN